MKGVISSIKTLADKTIRLQIDCAPEFCPTSIVSWQYEEVNIEKENGNAEIHEEGN